jgi:hypothetical protein
MPVYKVSYCQSILQNLCIVRASLLVNEKIINCLSGDRNLVIPNPAFNDGISISPNDVSSVSFLS